MKRLTLIVFILTAAIASNGQAQFSAGLKGGLNFAKFDANDFGGSIKNKTGFNFGAFTLFKFSKIGIQPEIVFSQQGSKFTFNSQDFESNFDYFNIPVIVKLYTIAGINVQVGPQFGFLTRAEIDNNDVKDSFKSSDLSAVLGLGWDLPFGLAVDARYNIGLSKIDDDQSFDAVKNQVFQLSLGYKFIKLGK